MVLKTKVTRNSCACFLTTPWGLKRHVGSLFCALGFLSTPCGTCVHCCGTMVMSH